MAASSTDLLIDLRAGAATPDLWSRALLGLTVLERAVSAARRAGFASVSILHDGDAAIGGLPVAVAQVAAEDLAGGVRAPTVIMSGDVLGEPAWLAAAAGQEIQPGECRRLAPGVALCGAGVHPDDAHAAAATEKASDIMRLTDANRDDAERRLLQSLRKETDGFMARVFARPISLFLSRRLARTRITPNAMTVISLMIGLAAAPFFLFDVWWLQAIGGLLFVAHSVVDGCDGELARLKFIESRFGGLLDFWSDNIVHVAVFGCMGLGWSWAIGEAWPLWLAVLAVAGTVGSAVTVYWLTMRDKSGGGPVYTSVATGESGGLTRLLDELSRRDFIYLVFILSLFGKAGWFLVPTAIGAPVFLVLVLTAAWRTRRT